MELNIFFESDDFAMIFSYQIPEGLAKHEPQHEVGVLLGALLFWTSEVVDDFFFDFPGFGEIFWLTWLEVVEKICGFV